MRRILILLAFAGALLLGTKTMAQTGKVTLAWNPSSSSEVAAYYIYYGTDTNNYNVVPVIGATNVTISGLTNGLTYYFAAASCDSNWNVGTQSAPITTTIGTVVAQAAGALSALVGLPAGQFGFALSGAANAQYLVQASTNLVNWVTLQTNIGSFQFIDSNTTQFSRRFYRTVSISN